MSEAQITKDLQGRMTHILKSRYGDQTSSRILRSVSFQACVDNLDEVKPVEFLYQCAAVTSLKREAVDPIIIKFICWLPCLLMEFSFDYVHYIEKK